MQSNEVSGYSCPSEAFERGAAALVVAGAGGEPEAVAVYLRTVAGRVRATVCAGHGKAARLRELAERLEESAHLAEEALCTGSPLAGEPGALPHRSSRPGPEYVIQRCGGKHGAGWQWVCAGRHEEGMRRQWAAEAGLLSHMPEEGTSSRLVVREEGAVRVLAVLELASESVSYPCPGCGVEVHAHAASDAAHCSQACEACEEAASEPAPLHLLHPVKLRELGELLAELDAAMECSIVADEPAVEALAAAVRELLEQAGPREGEQA